jgi:hypothetical protein
MTSLQRRAGQITREALPDFGDRFHWPGRPPEFTTLKNGAEMKNTTIKTVKKNYNIFLLLVSNDFLE